MVVSRSILAFWKRLVSGLRSESFRWGVIIVNAGSHSATAVVDGEQRLMLEQLHRLVKQLNGCVVEVKQNQFIAFGFTALAVESISLQNLLLTGFLVFSHYFSTDQLAVMEHQLYTYTFMVQNVKLVQHEVDASGS